MIPKASPTFAPVGNWPGSPGAETPGGTRATTTVVVVREDVERVPAPLEPAGPTVLVIVVTVGKDVTDLAKGRTSVTRPDTSNSKSKRRAKLEYPKGEQHPQSNHA